MVIALSSLSRHCPPPARSYLPASWAMRWITASAPCERSSPTRKYSKSYSDGTRKALAGLGRRIAYTGALRGSAAPISRRRRRGRCVGVCRFARRLIHRPAGEKKGRKKVGGENCRFFLLKSMTYKGGAERYYDKTERYYDKTERYYDGGGTLLRQKFCSYPQIRLLRR